LRVDGDAGDMIQALKPEPPTMRYELSDDEWSTITPLLPKHRCCRTSHAAFGV
jgi:hypothetical protein